MLHSGTDFIQGRRANNFLKTNISKTRFIAFIWTSALYYCYRLRLLHNRSRNTTRTVDTHSLSILHFHHHVDCILFPNLGNDGFLSNYNVYLFYLDYFTVVACDSRHTQFEHNLVRGFSHCDTLTTIRMPATVYSYITFKTQSVNCFI